MEKDINYLNSCLDNKDIDENLTPWYVTGITDGEGSFQITIQDMKGLGKTGYKPFLEYKVTQKNHSIFVLYKLQKFFNCGRINVDNNKTDTMKFVVTDNNDLVEKIIPHFDIYSLKTSKFLNYLDFKDAALLMRNKKHFTIEGIERLKSIKSNMNKARSWKDKFHYCWNNEIVLKPNWIQGFIDGEGSFQCEMGFPKRKNSRVNINFSLQIKQSSHDVAILYAIRNFFQCGFLKPKVNIRDIKAVLDSPHKTMAFWIRNYELICKFFDQFSLYTIKRFDYYDWKKLICLKKEKAHLTKDGLNIMKNIKNNMNASRFKSM